MGFVVSVVVPPLAGHLDAESHGHDAALLPRDSALGRREEVLGPESGLVVRAAVVDDLAVAVAGVRADELGDARRGVLPKRERAQALGVLAEPRLAPEPRGVARALTREPLAPSLADRGVRLEDALAREVRAVLEQVHLEVARARRHLLEGKAPVVHLVPGRHLRGGPGVDAIAPPVRRAARGRGDGAEGGGAPARHREAPGSARARSDPEGGASEGKEARDASRKRLGETSRG